MTAALWSATWGCIRQDWVERYLSVAVKNGAILAGPAWRPGRFAFGLFPAEVALVSQVAGAPTCQPGDVSAPTTSARVVLVVLPKWPLRALPLTS